MQNSSKKSWTQSRSRASDPPPPPPPPKGREPRSEQPSADPAGVVLPSSENAYQPKVKAIRIPMGFLAVTLEPRFFTAFVLSGAIYLLAAFFANEWMYLLSASFVVAVILGYVLPLMQVMEVQIDASMPEEVLVAEGAELRLRLRRSYAFGPLSLILPVRCLRIRINMLRRSTGNQPPEAVLSNEPLLVDQINDDLWLQFPIPGLRRGIYRLESIDIMSCFPFGLAWWTRTIKKKVDLRGNPLTLTVHPKNVPLSGNFLFQLKGMSSSMGLSSSESKVVVQSTSVRGVREFQMGDSIRHIHWPSSAKLGKLLVREFDSETLPVFDIMLDLRQNWKSREQFELAVCLVHSLVHLGHRLGTVPALLLNPPLESKILNSDLMFDLPKIPPGIDLDSEILARVEPLSMNAGGQDLEDRVQRGKAERPLMTIFPSQDQIMKFIPGKGDTLVSPIELTVIARDWDDDTPAIGEKDEIKLSASRGTAGKRRVFQKSPESVVIAKLESEVDLEPL